VIDEALVPIPGLRGACTSSEAVDAAIPIVRSHEPESRPWRIGTEDGCDPAGRSVRWEVRFDLMRKRAEAVITVAFTYDEASSVHDEAVASIRLAPFPAEGSELAKMALAGQITGRRLRAVWRQQMRERQPLPPDFPDSSAMVAAVAPDEVRSAYARITRLRGAVWVVETPGRTRHLRRDDL
jgi:hypothetical protein